MASVISDVIVSSGPLGFISSYITRPSWPSFLRRKQEARGGSVSAPCRHLRGVTLFATVSPVSPYTGRLPCMGPGHDGLPSRSLSVLLALHLRSVQQPPCPSCPLDPRRVLSLSLSISIFLLTQKT